MKKMGKRVWAMLLTVCMLCGICGALPTVSVMGEEQDPAADAAPQSGDWVLADFANGSDVIQWLNSSAKNWSVDDLSDEVTRPGKAQALKWEKQGEKQADGSIKAVNFRLKSPSYSGAAGNLGKLLSYDYLYAWIYSDCPNNQGLNILIYDTTTGKYQGLFNAARAVIDWSGWKLVRVDISAYTSASFDNGAAAAAETDEVYLQYQTSGWSVTPLETTTLFVDSVWFSNTDWYAQKEDDDAYGGKHMIIGDFSAEGGADGWGSQNGVKHSDNMQSEITRTGRGHALKWAEHYKDGKNYNIRLMSPSIDKLGTILDEGYRYYNAWIYSARATDRKMNGYLVDRQTGSGYNWTNDNAVPINWTGWKLVSLKLPEDLSLTNFNNGTTKLATESDSFYVQFQSSGFGLTPSEDIELYVDSIWLSEQNPNPTPELEMLYDFSIIDKTKYSQGSFTQRGANTGNQTYTRRFAADANPTYAGHQASLEIKPADNNYYFATTTLYPNNLGKVLTTKNQADGYINLLLYSEKANNQRLRLSLEGRTGADQTWRYYKTGIVVDWTGWRLISFKLSDLVKQNSDWDDGTKLNLIAFYFPDWGNGRETNKEGETYQYTDGSSNWDNIETKVLSDTALYLDSVFLSDRDMTERLALTASIADGAQNVAAETKTITFNAPMNFAPSKDGFAEAVSVTKNGETLSGCKVQAEGDKLCVALPETAGNSNTYQISVAGGFALEYGVSAPASLTFTTEAETPVPAPTVKTAYSFSDDNRVIAAIPESGVLGVRAAVTNDTEAAVSAQVLLAVYQDDCLVASGLGHAFAVEPGTSATLSASVELEDYAGCTVKAFVWNLDTLTPYGATIGTL